MVTKLRVTELSMPTRLSRHREPSLSVNDVSPGHARSGQMLELPVGGEDKSLTSPRGFAEGMP